MITYYFKAMPHDPTDKNFRKWKLVANRGSIEALSIGQKIEEEIVLRYAQWARVVLLPAKPKHVDENFLETYYAPGYRGVKRVPEPSTLPICSADAEKEYSYTYTFKNSTAGTVPTPTLCGQDVGMLAAEAKHYEGMHKEIPDNGNNLTVCKNGEIEESPSPLVNMVQQDETWSEEENRLLAAIFTEQPPKKNWFRRLLGF